MNNRIHSENRRASLAHRLALAPYSVWAVIFVAVPLVFVAYYAFTDESFRFTTENLTKFFTAVSTITDDSGATREVHTYLLIFWRSVKLAVISTAICLLMGYPIAYIIARAAPRTQKTIITLIMIPMWMNFLIRTYAWMTILQDSGLLNMLFSALHLGQAHIIGTEGAVVVGMVYDYFPYMILPIYSVMAKMDTRLIEAARDLGCNSLGVLRRVIFPLSLPGVMSGHHDGAHPVDQHLLYLAETRQRQVLPHRRRDRGAVRGQQPALCRRHRLHPHADPAGRHGPDEARHEQARLRRCVT